MGGVVGSLAGIGPGNVYIRRDVDEQQEEIDEIQEGLDHLDKLGTDLEEVQKVASEHQTRISSQADGLAEQCSELGRLREECRQLKAVENERRALHRERFQLELDKKRPKREDEILDLPFTCVQCQSELPLREVKNFCNCEASNRIKKPGVDPFEGMKGSLRAVFDEMDKGAKGHLDGADLCRLLALVALADVAAGDRAAKRKAAKSDTQRQTYGHSEQRAALRTFSVQGEQATFEAFWSHFQQAPSRPPLYVLDYLLQELAILTPLGEIFPHIPGEKDIRVFLRMDEIDAE